MNDKQEPPTKVHPQRDYYLTRLQDMIENLANDGRVMSNGRVMNLSRSLNEDIHTALRLAQRRLSVIETLLTHLENHLPPEEPWRERKEGGKRPFRARHTNKTGISLARYPFCSCVRVPTAQRGVRALSRSTGQVQAKSGDAISATASLVSCCTSASRSTWFCTRKGVSPSMARE